MIVTIVQGIKGITVLNVDTICSVVGVLGALFMVSRIGKITLLFNADALGSIDEEHKKQNEILQGVLEISKTVLIAHLFPRSHPGSLQSWYSVLRCCLHSFRKPL